ncbi:hypothetical protein P154DRAFT_210488 [Amniculicola lignicola CBS 123094]|uniref:Uncharacterized protein n=1 Tax=Amniculicola lignicola CBS 123094 TaxID=1392246 RepID=A0A6A5WFM8_9PLEO|nr:hypothetical protein P154DRAFT_210488 [Amniculicola lignicola CBS 123094]
MGLNGVHIALEDRIEKHPQKTPSIFWIETPNPFRRFAALPKDGILVLSACLTTSYTEHECKY